MSLVCATQAFRLMGRLGGVRTTNNINRVPRQSLVLDGKRLAATQTEALERPWLANINPNENDFIYKRIKSTLHEKFEGAVIKARNLPIFAKIQRAKETSKYNEDELKKLSASIKNDIQLMNQVELTSLLAAIKDFDDPESRSIKRMIDLELRWLLKENVKTRLMDLDLWLFISDIFYECKMRSKFVHVLTNYLAQENALMNNRQMLHLLFLIVLQRRQDGVLEKFERRIVNLVDGATFEDIAIICLAYFKTKTPIKNVELLRKIIDKTADSLEQLDPAQPGFCSVVKSIRYSKNNPCRENVVHLILSLTEGSNKQIIFTSPYNAVQTVKLMETYRVYDPKLVHLLRVTMFKNLEEFRIKDIQYAMSSLCNLNYMDLQLDSDLRQDFDKLAAHIVSELRHDVHHQHYHLVALVRSLATFGYYNDELIAYTSRVLEDSHKLDRMLEGLEFERSALLLYVSTMLEGGKQKLDSDSGVLHRLSDSIQRVGNFGSVKQDSSLSYLDFVLRGQNSQNHLANSSAFRLIAVKLAATEELSDPEYRLNFQYTFPHQNYADLIISKGRPEPGSFGPFNLMPQTVPKGQRHCLVFATNKRDYIDGDKLLCGYKRFVLRLLAKLNYDVLVTDLHEPDIELLARKAKHILDSD